MQGIGYVLKVWLSGLILTPVTFLLLLALLPGYHIPELIGFILIQYIIPYTFIVSIWVLLSLFCAISLLSSQLTKPSIKVILSLLILIIIYLGFVMLQHIRETMMYNDSFILPIAYATSTITFVFVYGLKLIDRNPATNPPVAKITYALVYSLMVWLLTFLLSVPAMFFINIFNKTQDSAGSLTNFITLIKRQYHLQLNISICYAVTLLLISLCVINVNIDQYKKKLAIILFACPLCMPVYFYYLFFSGALIHYPVIDLLTLTLPSLIISIGSISIIKLKNAV